MTQSLKSQMPALARAFRMKADGLYERQRALVREGLLESKPGHGPGSGVRATPDSVAMLLISLLSSVNLTDTASSTREMAKAMPVDGKCPFTGATNLRDALAKILSVPSLLDRMTRLSITGLAGSAEIGFRRNRVSAFKAPELEKHGVQFTLSLDFEELPDIDSIMAGIMGGE
ncbi:hypothetical protein [Bauldia litoralis]|uniref:hypothetical protein n=1 Tax=Bauldia litoralis TaxID=665467 RepID=UPI0032670FB2